MQSVWNTRAPPHEGEIIRRGIQRNIAENNGRAWKKTNSSAGWEIKISLRNFYSRNATKESDEAIVQSLAKANC